MIEVRELYKSFDGFRALKGLNINVPKGAVYGLVGPNGAGKSTLIRHLAGIYRQDSGEVNVVEVSTRGAVMHSSTCHNQNCVMMGEVTLDNWEMRPNQQFIICLPNRVSVELAVSE